MSGKPTLLSWAGVIVPHLNNALYLRRMIEWYATQEEVPHLIVVDCSTHPSILSGVRQLAADHGFVTLAEKPEWNRGDRSLFFKQLAWGGWIAKDLGCSHVIHAGADDLILPEGLKYGRAALTSPGALPCRLALGGRHGFQLEGARGPITGFTQTHYDEKLADSRFLQRMIGWVNRPYTLQFALIELELFTEIHQMFHTDLMPTFYFGNEMFVNLALALHSPVHFYTEPTVLFQYRSDKAFDWNTNASVVQMMTESDWAQTLYWARHRLNIYGENLYGKQWSPNALDLLLAAHLETLLRGFRSRGENLAPPPPPRFRHKFVLHGQYAEKINPALNFIQEVTP